MVPHLAALNGYPYCGHSALMGRRKRPWQDVDYVLRSFGKRIRNARREYWAYVEAGVEQGRRRDLVGGGLVRSLGGWTEVEKLGLRGQDHIKSDERILGDSGFVDSVLGYAEEYYARQYALRRRGYNLEKVAERVAGIYGIKVGEIFGRGRQQQRVGARSLFCYWAVRELGNSLASLAMRLEMSVAGIGYAVQKGEAIAQQKGYKLIP
jgi:putative transposase